MLALFLFNLAGYRVFFFYLTQQHKISLESRLDNQAYDNSELLELRVPLDMPYIADQSNFERVDGAITIAGKDYKYVKRKIENGQLVLLCLPDTQKTYLTTAGNEFGNHVNGLPVAAKKVPVLAKKSFDVTEYEQLNKLLIQQNSQVLLRCPSLYFTAPLTCGYAGFSDKPPESHC